LNTRGWLGLALLLASLVINLAWISQDRLLRDGDEEGHVGAAELFLDDLRGGRVGGFVKRAVVEDMGDYPSLYPAAVGAWWRVAGGGQPGRGAVRSVNLLFLGLAAAGVYAAARCHVAAGPALLGAAAVTWLPLQVGIARHFMPEGALAAAVSLTVAAAAWQRRRPTPARAALLGLALAAGLLTKQTFPLYVAAPVLLTVRWKPSLLAAAAGLVIAAPWYANNLIEQLSYVGDSAAYKGSAGWLAHALYYPQALAGLGLGPVWCALGLAAAAAAWTGRSDGGGWRLIGLCAAWLVGGMLLLSLVPKKYDRLLVPLLPAAGLAVAAGAAARPRWGALVLAGVGWTGWLSWAESPMAAPPQPVVDFEPGCIQVWLRPPDPRGAGFEAIGEAARAGPYGPIELIEPPAIPCDVQTTHGWAYHLSPWLRRAGLDRPIQQAGEPADAAPTLVVDFRDGADGERVSVPLLETSYALRR